MDTVRSLSIVLELIDNASRKLKEVQETITSVEDQEVVVGVTADTSAAVSNITEVTDASKQATNASDNFKKAIEGLKGAFASVSSSLSNFKGRLEDLKKGFDEVSTSILGIQVATGGLIFITAKAAMEEEQLAAAMKSAFEDSYDAMMQWVAAADNVTEVMRPQRMEMALLMQQAGLTNEKIIEYSETLEAFWRNPALRFRAQAAGISSLTELAKQVQFVEMGGGQADALNKLFGKENIEDIIQYGHGAKKVISLMNREIEKMGDYSTTTEERVRAFTEILEEFQSEIGAVLLPTISQVLEILTNIIRIIKQIPGAQQFIGFGVVFAFIAATLGMVAMAAVNGILQLIGFIELLQKINIVSKVASAGLFLIRGAIFALNAAMATNPVLLGLMAIAAILIALELKFKIFSRALEALKKVDWAKVIEEALKKVSSIVDFLLDKLKAIREAFGKIGGIKGFLSFASPGMVMLSLPLKFLEEVMPEAISIVRGIYNEIKKRFDEFRRIVGNLIPGWLVKIFEMVNGFWEWIKGAWNAFTSWFKIPWAEEKKVGTQGAVPRGLTPEEELKLNASQYRLAEAQGLMGGVPAPEVAGMEGKQPPFGGKFVQYAFRNPQGVVRTGKQLSEEQLLSGLWEPVTLVDELGGFIRDLTEEEKKQIKQELEEARKQAEQPPKPIKKPAEEEPTYHLPAPSSSVSSWKTEEDARKAGRTRTQAPSDLPQAPEEQQDAFFEERQTRGVETGVIKPGSAPPGGVSWEEAQEQGIGEGVTPPPKEEEKKDKKEKPSWKPSWLSWLEKKLKRQEEEEEEEGTLIPYGGQIGGTVEKTGWGLVHRGEEIISEQQRRTYIRHTMPNILKDIEQIRKDILTAKAYTAGAGLAPGTMPVASGGALAPSTIIINAPLIENAHIASHMDLDAVKSELIRWLRFEIRSALKS